MRQSDPLPPDMVSYVSHMGPSPRRPEFNIKDLFLNLSNRPFHVTYISGRPFIYV